MKKEVAKKWIKALRSGKYKQGQGTLKQYNRKGQPQHCCLGVLCELYNHEMKKNHKKTISEKIVDLFFTYKITKFGNQTDILPSVVRNWAGIKSESGDFTTEDDTYDSLVGMNDTGKKFKSIANTIEKQWENL